ncbi:MAG: CoA pyrophosphatase [Proteobacteria bacterium]|nr:CoA pyrophosphatase [Pseudomonadota bacterium]
MRSGVVLSVPDVESMRVADFESRLAATLQESVPKTRWRAASVAVVLRDGPEGCEVLLTRRTRRAGDRWSGHMAFPGGLAEELDEGPVATAQREAMEEVGLALGDPIGRLRPLWTATPGRLRPLRVFPFVFSVTEPVLVLEEREVAEALWIPWEHLASRRHRVWRRHRVGPIRMPLPSIELGQRLVWGLTLGMIDDLARTMNRPR